jgi:paraquat-inducible protein A
VNDLATQSAGKQVFESSADSMPPKIIACHECDLLNHVPVLAPDTTARCTRCNGVLYRNPKDCLDRTLALAFASLALYLVAVTFPFLAFGSGGNVVETSLLTGVRDLHRQGLDLLAAVVLITSVIAPAAVIFCYMYLLLPLKRGRSPVYVQPVYRALRAITPWNMIEVFLLGILVALVKLAGMAEVIPGIAVWSFAGLIITLASASSNFEPAVYWNEVERCR